MIRLRRREHALHFERSGHELIDERSLNLLAGELNQPPKLRDPIW